MKLLNKNAKRFYPEQGGFEPPVPYGTTVFKTASFNHSDTAPMRQPVKGCFSKNVTRAGAGKPITVCAAQILLRIIFSTEQGGFGVPVANVLFAPSTPAFAFPGASCTGFIGYKAIALEYLQKRSVSNPPL